MIRRAGERSGGNRDRAAAAQAPAPLLASRSLEAPGLESGGAAAALYPWGGRIPLDGSESQPVPERGTSGLGRRQAPLNTRDRSPAAPMAGRRRRSIVTRRALFSAPVCRPAAARAGLGQVSGPLCGALAQRRLPQGGRAAPVQYARDGGQGGGGRRCPTARCLVADQWRVAVCPCRGTWRLLGWACGCRCPARAPRLHAGIRMSARPRRRSRRARPLMLPVRPLGLAGWRMPCV